jgi:hypothetical protein
MIESCNHQHNQAMLQQQALEETNSVKLEEIK